MAETDLYSKRLCLHIYTERAHRAARYECVHNSMKTEDSPKGSAPGLLCVFGENNGTVTFLTTSAISSIPFLEEANSLLGRTESRTVWRGRVESGASMSPIVEKRFPKLQTVQTAPNVTGSMQSYEKKECGGVSLLGGGDGNNDSAETSSEQHLHWPDVKREAPQLHTMEY